MSLVIELFDEIINRSMIQLIDINVDEGVEKSYRIHDMMIDPICFYEVKKTTSMALSESDLSKGKI